MTSLVLVNPKRRLSARYETGILSFAFALAATVFYLDTFTDIHSALATLYVITLLLSAETLTEKGTLLLTAVCVGLSILSYAAAHGTDADLAAILRLAVAVAAILITCALIIRNNRARHDLIKSNIALQSSEERYRTIFEQSRVALWERDYSEVRALLMKLKEQGVVDLRSYARANPNFIGDCIARIPTVAANAAALELLGNVSAQNAGSMRRYIAQDDETFLDLMVAIFDNQGYFEGKGTIITSDGTTKLVLLTVGFPVDVANFNRVIVGMFDITERELAQKALFEAQAELALASRAATVGALSASLAHELNQPLGALVVNAQTLQRWLDRDPPDLAAVSRSAERIVRDSQRASDIIQSTRSMLSEHTPVLESVSLADLVSETKALMESELSRNRISFETSEAPGITNVSAVRIELQQVLINLITNAIQAMAATPEELRRILVSINPADGRGVRVNVRDSGPGLSADILEKLFKPFCTTKKTGLGMGLAICRGMLEARGGSLTASTQTEGGALFEMIVPMEAVHE
ncbi:sensor histidine kinase [Rhizobium leguminosarum]|uniref:sensor histidine kinase n=1 Tax=Rhizobium leguminosarum TaxID=384 RepID=UPI0013DD3A63|nr:ATP-binding protein [Rhizobium leguminosarum]NEI03133.1 two-component sensor histidine kinase [Rhizobium leguminosarum]NEJ82428.1 two-component sensor histidine kinase [Rhizobium leguminosarum]